MGTDYPFPLGEVTGYADAYPGKAIEDCDMIDENVKQKLLFENGMKFLGLDPSQYSWEIYNCGRKYMNLREHKMIGSPHVLTKFVLSLFKMTEKKL